MTVEQTDENVGQGHSSFGVCATARCVCVCVCVCVRACVCGQGHFGCATHSYET